MSEELLRTRISSILTKIRNCDLPQRNFNKFVRIIKGFQKLFISCELIYWYRAAAETDRAETSVWEMESSGCETTPSCVNEWSDTLKEETGLQIAEIQYKIHSDYLIFPWLLYWRLFRKATCMKQCVNFPSVYYITTS